MERKTGAKANATMLDGFPRYSLTSRRSAGIATCMATAKILVVDDELDMARLAAKRLRKAGYDVVCHYEGSGMIDLVRKERPDLILLDVWLPGASGIDLFKELRRDEILNGIPVVFFSAIITAREMCLQSLGAEGFVTKPFEAEDLLQQIGAALKPERAG